MQCDESHPCRGCTDLGVDCTFNRQMKRRGPPNKHAEAAKAAKQARLEPNISPSPHNAAETLISIAGGQDAQQAMDAEAIAPWPVLTLLIDDFFIYIHPLAPFPHEPTFRMSFTAREDRTNKGFLALLASMIGALVASFPRTARLHLKAHPHGMHMYPKAITLIEKCRAIALQARGPSFYSREDISVYDAATSYFLGLAAAYTMQLKVCRRFMSEAMTFIRELGYHKPRDMGSSMFGVTYRGPPFNHVEDQLGKRIFWTMFLGIRSMYQLGPHHSDVILPPPTPSEPYPELPVEVDDQYILTHQILGQPEGTVSLLTGFNQAIKIYMTMNGLVSVELSYGISTLPFQDQKSMLDESLQAVKQVMEGMPRELTIDLSPGGTSTGTGQSSHPAGMPDLVPGTAGTGPANVFEDTTTTASLHTYFPTPYPAATVQAATDFRPPPVGAQPERRRLLQYEIQKGNIYASQIATRSYYVERYLTLRDAHREQARAQAQAAEAVNFAAAAQSNTDSTSSAAGTNPGKAPAPNPEDDPIDAAMLAERELIANHLLIVLSSLSQRSMEPNGASLITKIRQVASTLINTATDATGHKPAGLNPTAALANLAINPALGLAVGLGANTASSANPKTQEMLSKFVEVLTRLERIPSATTSTSLAGIGALGALNLGGTAAGGIVGGVGGVGDGTGHSSGVVGEDEERELRVWADLRDPSRVPHVPPGVAVGAVGGLGFLQGGGWLGWV